MNYLSKKKEVIDIKTFKIVLLGCYAVGKTTLAHRLQGRELIKTESTIGASFNSFRHKINENQDYITFNIWDTAGQERYRSLTKIYFRGAYVCIMMYDLTDLNSLQEIKDSWLPSFFENKDEDKLENVRIYLVGNKLDKYNKSKTLDTVRNGMISEIKQKYVGIQDFELSLLDSKNVELFIKTLINDSINTLTEEEKKGLKKNYSNILHQDFYLDPTINSRSNMSGWCYLL